jgi:hypothetical protein
LTAIHPLLGTQTVEFDVGPAPAEKV